MEATTVCILILLAVVGARNIPTQRNGPSEELQQILRDNLSIYTNVVPKDGLSKDLVESAVSADLEPFNNNKDYDYEKEKSEAFDLNAVNMNIGIEAEDVDYDKYSIEQKVNENKPTDDMKAVMQPVEVKNEDKETVEEFEDRQGALDGKYCTKGTIRVGDQCWPVDPDTPPKSN